MKEKAEDEQQEAGTRIRAAILAGRVHTAAEDFVTPQERRKSSSGQSGVNNVHVCDGVLTSICTLYVWSYFSLQLCRCYTCVVCLFRRS